MRYKRICVAICALFFSVSSSADTASQALSRLFSQVTTIQASFTQRVTDKKGRLLQYSTGKMVLSRPNQFRWEVIKPVEQLIIANNKKLWVYDPDLQQVTIRLLNQEAGETPALLLTRTNAALEKSFSVASQMRSGMQWFRLTPKDKSSLFEAIELGFSHQVIQEMQLTDHLGQKTTIQFNQVRTNGMVSASLFQFIPPAHTDVIDESKH